MSKTTMRRPPALKLVALTVAGLLAAPAVAQQLPDLGSSTAPWKVDVYYDNHTAFRGKDNTGDRVGLSKFRNTLQAETEKELSNDWTFRGIMRGSWDGVYRMNSDQYGKDAGGSIMLESTLGGARVPVPHAGDFASGVVDYATVRGALYDKYLELGIFGDASDPDVQAAAWAAASANKILSADEAAARSPNKGLRVLGDRWHDIKGGVAFGVPVRPCDYDKRGCADFGGYGDKKLSELEAPEFNDRLDFIREAYVRKSVQLDDGKELFLKIGKQQVVWGRTDLFRVLDVVNPVDYSRNNIYDELQDIRIPMWIAQAEWRMGPSESMQDRNLQLIWNFDKFRPNNLGQCGSPNAILDAGCFFRGMKSLWENGGTVANFANLGAANNLIATNFGPGQIGLNEINLPDWSLDNTQIGAKFEGVTQEGLAFSLNALYYRSQLPSLHGGKRSTNGFTGVYRENNPYLISFDMEFPRVKLLGGSLDFQSEALGAAFRVEGAMSWGEEFANTARPELYSSNKVWRSVIGIDRPTFIPFINPHRTTLISAQLFWQHIFDHEYYSTGTKAGQNYLGPVGMPDWKDNYIATLLVKGFMMNDRLSPELIIARDFKAHATAIAPAVEWSMTDNLKLTFGGNFKVGTAEQRFDDCRACNPWEPFTAPFVEDGQPQSLLAYSRGLGGIEPLGRFRAGPIGTAMYEDEVYFKLKYQF